MEKTIISAQKANPDDPLTYYQGACLFSLSKDERRAVKWLEKAFQLGFGSVGYQLNWLQSDTDLDNIRNSKRFKALVKKYFPDQFTD